MNDFNILHGLSTELFSAPGVVNPDLIIEEGHWYLCTDTAELFLGTSDQDNLVLKKINANILDQVLVSVIKLEIIDGNLIATYSDGSVVDLGKVIDDIPTNVSSLVNDAGYITAADIPEIDLSDYAKKSDIPDVSDLIKDIPSEYVTESELEAKGYLTEHQSLGDYATKKYVEDAIAEIEIPEDVDLSTYAKKTEIPTKVSELTNDRNYLTAIPAEYITESELSAKNYLTEHQSLAAYATKTFVENTVVENQPNLTAYAKKSDIPDVSEFITSIPAEYITEAELSAKNYLTEHQDISHLALKASIPVMVSALENDASYATEQYVIDAIAASVPVDELAKKEEVVEVKTKLEVEVLPAIKDEILPVVHTAATQDWVKEQGYLTEHQDLSEYAKKTELFSKSYNDLSDTPEIPSVEGLASEEYVNRAIANIDIPTIDLSDYALRSEVKVKADDIPFTRSKLVTKAIGSFSTGDDVKGLTIAAILAKLLGLEADAIPDGIIEEIIAYKIPMYSVTSAGVLAEIPYKYLEFSVDAAKAVATESGFYQIVDESGKAIESGYQEMQINCDSVYYVIALPKAVDYNTMVTIQSYNPIENVWAEVEKFNMTSDPAEVAALCEEASIDISRIDADAYTIWASDICPDGSPLRFIITEEAV